MNQISPRVSNATGAAGGSAPLTIIFIYYLNKYAGPLDPTVAGAWATLFTGAAAFLGGYLTRLEAVVQPPDPVPAPPPPAPLPLPVAPLPAPAP